MKYNIKQLSPGIFFLEANDSFDLSMLFLRAQEYFESPYKNIRNKNFTIIEYIKTYSKDNENGFSYMVDWAGFNVAGKYIEKLYGSKTVSNIKDFNSYDEVMQKIHQQICTTNQYKKGMVPDQIDLTKKKKVPTANSVEEYNNHYYLIGALKNDRITLKHELCHALFNLHSSYMSSAYVVLASLPDSAITKINKWLLGLGYCKESLDDEIQAYLTHECEDIFEDIKFNKKEHKALTKASESLRNNFNKYVKIKG